MTISLPKKPDGDQFEGAVAAAVRSIGYFIETRTILDHEGREVLELDIVASPATTNFHAKVLLDAKKATAKFGDIFKIYGWRTFLKIPKGCVVFGGQVEARDMTAFNEVCPKLDVYAEHFDITKEVALSTVPILNPGAEEQLRLITRLIGWYQFTAERLCSKDYNDRKKENEGDEIFTRVHQYRRACHLAFFESDPLRRVELLYDAFKKDPHITGACVEWQAAKLGKTSKSVLDAVLDSALYPWIQHVLALESKARILIIKNGLEAAMLDEGQDKNMEGFWKAFKLAMLPRNFQTGFKRLSKSPHKHAVPFILQLYVEVFGGFLVEDKDQLHLAALSGVPAEVVTEALQLFDVFFPFDNGWYQQSKELSMMKMIPAYLRGTGAFFRQSLLGLKDYKEAAPQMGWLLSKWHNSTLKILESELGVKEDKKEEVK